MDLSHNPQNKLFQFLAMIFSPKLYLGICTHSKFQLYHVLYHSFPIEKEIKKSNRFSKFLFTNYHNF